MPKSLLVFRLRYLNRACDSTRLRNAWAAKAGGDWRRAAMYPGRVEAISWIRWPWYVVCSP